MRRHFDLDGNQVPCGSEFANHWPGYMVSPLSFPSRFSSLF
jgi:hypothetical protein